ncbi:hypothetical protein [Mycolicibacterium komossense]|uniref:Uncharacterized protein n=1 Tax=Mycolicibacterium komossense TaxID=1779 RepID=A0ABT3CJ80_9MYCO|nr:hypothetical protein [Mycolicibacterium komossense]MCV7229545.1 hypothetical protein [Mycolicibacterium komossense]
MVTDSRLVFFSFVALDNPSAKDHRRYNEWHQLDHRPENLALPGVAWGDRWARTAECRAASVSEPEQSDTDYVAMYWFREPAGASVREWEQLGADSFQWGRGPMIPGVRRTLLAFFRPVKGYAANSSLVSAGVIPYRPNRGIQVTVTRFADPLGGGTHGHHQWEDRALIPALLEVPGVAGAWTFALDHHQDNGLGLRSVEAAEHRGGLRVRILYLDDDPITTTARVYEKTDEVTRLLDESSVAAAELVFSSPLRTIIPWQDW